MIVTKTRTAKLRKTAYDFSLLYLGDLLHGVNFHFGPVNFDLVGVPVDRLRKGGNTRKDT